MPPLRREVRQIIFEHFELIVEEWNRHMKGTQDAGR